MSAQRKGSVFLKEVYLDIPPLCSRERSKYGGTESQTWCQTVGDDSHFQLTQSYNVLRVYFFKITKLFINFIEQQKLKVTNVEN